MSTSFKNPVAWKFTDFARANPKSEPETKQAIILTSKTALKRLAKDKHCNLVYLRINDKKNLFNILSGYNISCLLPIQGQCFWSSNWLRCHSQSSFNIIPEFVWFSGFSINQKSIFLPWLSLMNFPTLSQHYKIYSNSTIS